LLVTSLFSGAVITDLGHIFLIRQKISAIIMYILPRSSIGLCRYSRVDDLNYHQYGRLQYCSNYIWPCDFCSLESSKILWFWFNL